jgi:hypothetical protein
LLRQRYKHLFYKAIFFQKKLNLIEKRLDYILLKLDSNLLKLDSNLLKLDSNKLSSEDRKLSSDLVEGILIYSKQKSKLRNILLNFLFLFGVKV